MRNNIDALLEVLTDPDLGGLASERCVTVLDPVEDREVYRRLRRTAPDATDAFIVYFAGHDIIEPRRGELYLGLTDTDPDELRVSGLSIELIREVVADCPATNRVLILDCCFSGRAVNGFMTRADDAFLAQVGISGAYTLASAPANSPALAPPGARFTAFTGELVTLLREGIPGGPRAAHARNDLPATAPHHDGTGTAATDPVWHGHLRSARSRP